MLIKYFHAEAYNYLKMLTTFKKSLMHIINIYTFIVDNKNIKNIDYKKSLLFWACTFFTKVTSMHSSFSIKKIFLQLLFNTVCLLKLVKPHKFNRFFMTPLMETFLLLLIKTSARIAKKNFF